MILRRESASVRKGGAGGVRRGTAPDRPTGACPHPARRAGAAHRHGHPPGPPPRCGRRGCRASRPARTPTVRGAWRSSVPRAVSAVLRGIVYDPPDGGRRGRGAAVGLPRYLFRGPVRGPLASGPGMTVAPRTRWVTTRAHGSSPGAVRGVAAGVPGRPVPVSVPVPGDARAGAAGARRPGPGGRKGRTREGSGSGPRRFPVPSSPAGACPDARTPGGRGGGPAARRRGACREPFSPWRPRGRRRRGRRPAAGRSAGRCTRGALPRR